MEATCDRILIINRGRIVADGSAENLRKQASGQEILKIRIEDGDPNAIFEALQNLSSVAMVDFADRQQNRFEIQSQPGSNAAKDVFQSCVKNNWILMELIPFETKLEDIFRELTTN